MKHSPEARVHIDEILGCTQEMRSESIPAQSDMGIRMPRGYSDIHNGPDSRRTLDMLFATLISANDYFSQILHRCLAVAYFRESAFRANDYCRRRALLKINVNVMKIYLKIGIFSGKDILF